MKKKLLKKLLLRINHLEVKLNSHIAGYKGYCKDLANLTPEQEELYLGKPKAHVDLAEGKDKTVVTCFGVDVAKQAEMQMRPTSGGMYKMPFVGPVISQGGPMSPLEKEVKKLKEEIKAKDEQIERLLDAPVELIIENNKFERKLEAKEQRVNVLIGLKRSLSIKLEEALNESMLKDVEITNLKRELKTYKDSEEKRKKYLDEHACTYMGATKYGETWTRIMLRKAYDVGYYDHAAEMEKKKCSS